MSNKIIKLTESQLNSIIKNSIREVFEELGLITEYGLNIDRKTRTVEYDPTHQENLDTSLENNPTETVEVIEGMEVHKFSIFQRKPSQLKGLGDGNPALYALKNERGWVLTNEDAFFEQFEIIVEKFIETVHPTNVIVPMPSTNPLNTRIVRILRRKIGNAAICRPIRKMTVEEVWDRVDDGASFFDRYWKEKGVDLNEKYIELDILLGEMKENNNGIFSYHHIKDMEMRESIINTLIAIPEEYARYNEAINGSDILLIDDSITRGQSIRDAVYAIKQMYEPKSITVLIMFSELKR